MENVAKDLQSGMFFSTTFCFYFFDFTFDILVVYVYYVDMLMYIGLVFFIK